MAAVIIKEKDLNLLASTLLNVMFEFLHNEYIFSEFKEMKEVQKDFLNKLCLNYIDTLHRKFEITGEERIKLIEPLTGKLLLTDEKKPYFEKSNNYDSKLVEEAMKDGCIDTQGIYDTIKFLKLDNEANGDLYYKMKAFLNIFDVFKSDYSYLED